MKYIVKKSFVELPPVVGGIADTRNIENKVENTYSARIIEELASSSGGGADISTIVDLLYPVGRGFLDFTDTDYSNWLGLTWERELVGMTAIGKNPNDTDFATVGAKGGEKTHTLTVNEMPSHTHIQNSHNHTQNAHNHSQNAHSHGQTFNSDNGSSYGSDWVRSGGSSGTRDTRYTGSTTATNNATTATNNATTATNQNTGGGQAHNNLPPYQVVSYWKRVDPNAKTMISFRVNSVSCQAEEGMTWAEWCNSSYNTLGYYTSGNLVYGSSGTYLSSATASSVIGNGAAYYYSKEK